MGKPSHALRIAAGLATLSVGAVCAQERRAEPVIEAGPNHIVSEPRAQMDRNEVWVAASHKDPNAFVAVFHATVTSPEQFACESMVSRNGGQTWRRVRLEGENDCFDPMVVSGANGQFYISYSAWRVPEPRFGDWAGVSAPIRIYTSLDEGESWSAPLNLITPLRPDHQRKAVDFSGGRFDGRVYVAWVEFPSPTVAGRYHLFLHYLDREGRTQSKPKLVLTTGEARPDALEPLVLSDGTLLLPLWYQPISMLSSAYSGNAGVPFDPQSERVPIYLVRSTDGGDTFSAPDKIFEAHIPVWRSRVHRFRENLANPPIFAVDTSRTSRFRDRLYAVWNDVRAGATTDIWLAWSADKGRTWSAPVRVNDFAEPLGQGKPPDVRLTPVVAVNKDGVVGVAWYDRREDPLRRCWKQYFSASMDGGRTFLENRAISTAASCPPPNKPPIVEVYNETEEPPPSWEELRKQAHAVDQARTNEADHKAAAAMARLAEQAKARIRAEEGLAATSRMHVSFDSARSEFLGHYTGLAAAADGSFLAVWADRRRGNQEIYSARVRVGTPRVPRRLEGRKLNEDVEVITEDVAYEAATGITTVQVKLRNRSKRPIYPPLAVRIRDVVLGGGEVAANADKNNAGPGAEWDFSTRLGIQNRLDPGMISEPRALQLRSAPEHGLDLIVDYDVLGRTAVD